MNKRTKDIVGELLKTEKPLTIAGLAKKFKVSERTIRNDLNSINDWLDQNGLSLITLGSSGRIDYKPEMEEVQKFVLENDFYSYKLSKEEDADGRHPGFLLPIHNPGQYGGFAVCQPCYGHQ